LFENERLVRFHWHALRIRACHPGRANAVNESTSTQSLALIGFSYIRLYLSAALGGRPSRRLPRPSTRPIY
jgi:hypothetical protein